MVGPHPYGTQPIFFENSLFTYGTAPTTQGLSTNYGVPYRSRAMNAVDEFIRAMKEKDRPAAYMYPDSEISEGMPQWQEQSLLGLLPFRKRFAITHAASLLAGRPVPRLRRGREVDHTRRRRQKRKGMLASLAP
jgi:hypothetical protein